MSTPCVLAYGTPSSWIGVPCKLDGSPGSTGPVLLDAMLRQGFDGAAKKLVLDVPLGWVSAGGCALEERDDYLVGEGLSSATPREILDRHYALYLFDRERGCLDITVLGTGPACEPVYIPRRGALASLPSWYPQPNPAARTAPHVPSGKAAKRVQKFCEENRIRWPLLRDALRAWCVDALGDLRGVSWLLAGSPTAERYVGGDLSGAMLYIEPGEGTARFTSSDGLLRSIDIDDVRRAGNIVDGLARLPQHSGEIGRTGLPLPRHASAAIEQLLSAAYAEACRSPTAHVSWAHHTSTWAFYAPSDRHPNATELERYPQGWLAPFLALVLF